MTESVVGSAREQGLSTEFRRRRTVEASTALTVGVPLNIMWVANS